MNTSKLLSETLVDHIPKIRRIVSKIAKNEGVVDDITQEACVRIIEKERLWRKRSNKLPQWMNTVARNLTKDHLKKKREHHLERVEDFYCYPETKNFSEAQIEWVTIQFQTLSQKQQQILNMKYYQNMTVTQIGKKLGITHQAVSQHITLALKVFRKRARSQGLLVALLPWNWDYFLSMQVVVVSKIKLCAVLFCLTLIGFLGYEFFGVGTVDRNNGQLSSEKGHGFVGPERDKKDKGNFFVSRDLIHSTESLKTEGSNVDLEITLNWLKKIRNYRYKDWTIEQLRDVKKLDLSNLKLTDSDMKYLIALTSLTTLDINSTNITDRGLQILSRMTSLTSLHVGWTGITDEGLKELLPLKSLTFLGLSGAGISGEGLKALSSLDSLTTLDMLGLRTRFTSESIEALTSLRSLRELDLRGTEISDEDLKELSKLTSLTSLSLNSLNQYEEKITDKGVKELSSMTNLTKLEVMWSEITDEGLKSLSHLSSLTNLNLETNRKITDQGLKELSFLESLTHLNLGGTAVTGEGLKELSSLGSLTHLNLSSTKIKIEDMKKLPFLISLSSLNLGWNANIIDEDMGELVHCFPYLKKLYLTHTQVTDKGLKLLTSLKSLNYLELRSTKVTNQGLEDFKEILPNCRIEK